MKSIKMAAAMFSRKSQLSLICRQYLRRNLQPSCCISTTNKTTDTRILGPIQSEHPKEDVNENTVIARWREGGVWKEAKNPKDWVSFGYHEYDAESDRWEHRQLMFFMLSLTLFAGFLLKFKPDFSLNRDWTVREAYMELARREKNGLPLVDMNYIPEEKLLAQLPEEEEIEDQDAII